MSPAGDITRILVCARPLDYAADLSAFLEQDADIRVVGRARTAAAAMSLLPRARADLVIVDLDVGDDDVVGRIMATRPLPIVVLDGQADGTRERMAAALEAGALTAVAKRDLPLADPLGARAVMARRQLKRLSHAAIGGTRIRTVAASRSAGVPTDRHADVIGIAASTGGPVALCTVLAALPADFAVPIVVVQHIAHGFLDGLIAWLDGRIVLPVRQASDGQRLAAGVALAPEHAHLVLDRGLRTRFDADQVAGYHRPSADVLLSSLARVGGSRSVAVVLTGMGTDGAEGLAAVRAAGGLTMAQNESSSVVYGMPRAAAEAGAELVMPPAEIGAVLSRLRPPEDRR